MWLGTELFNGSFGNKYTSNDVQTHIDYCVDLGLDKIDTAECYGVEKMLGDALIGKRNKFFVGTKFGHDNEKKPNSESYTLTLPSVKKQLNESLKNLRTDYIDIYYYHSGGNDNFCNDEIWEFLNKKVDSGVIRHLGLSLKHSLVIEKDFTQINKMKEYGITVVQTVLNMYSQHSLEYIIPFCKKNKIHVLGRMPLAKGLLTGKYKQNHHFDNSDCRSNSIELNHEILDTYHNITPKEAIIWCKKHVDDLVIGSKTINQMKENYNLINGE
jgi:aryl-alcohol dehydrogenase-like predicted oxidoreductase